MTASEILARDILILEVKRSSDLASLKTEAHDVLQSMRPINLIKNTIEDVTHSPEIKGDIGKAVIGMATGFLLKKLVFGSSKGIVKNSVGSIFQTLATNVATRNSDKIAEGGSTIFEIVKALIMPKKNEVYYDDEYEGEYEGEYEE